MLSAARALVPLALLSILALLMVVADDGLIANARVAGVTATPGASALPASEDAATRAAPADRAQARSSAEAIAAESADPTAMTLVPEPSRDPTPAPVAPASPVPTARPPAVLPAPTLRPTAPPALTLAACPSDWFCYPRLGVGGPIVPYTDCAGGSDIGTAIRAFTCLTPRYLMGHAYTQFGAITAWRAGDTVTAYGQTFTITGAVTARSCEPPPLPLAPLSLQTSLSPNGCGAVLIVQAR
jgi:hypothetical protein